MSTDLRSGLIRLAFANPELRADLLPLIEKEAAGKKQDKVRAVNEKGTVVWVKKDTLRDNPGKFKPYKHEEDAGKGGGAEQKSEKKSEKKDEGKKDEGGAASVSLPAAESKKLGEALSQWHESGSDPLYAVSSNANAGKPIPADAAKKALGKLTSMLENADAHGLDDSDKKQLSSAKKMLEKAVGSKSEKPKSEVKKKLQGVVSRLPEKKRKTVMTLATEHNLESPEVAEVVEKAKQLVDKNAKSRKSPEQRKQDFLKMMDASKYNSPEAFAAAKERIKKMSAGDFETMVFAIAEDEAEGGGKTASLRAGLIRLAYANPSLRPTLLPLIEKHAGDDEAMGEGDMAAVLEAEADPTSHDQNLPEHYYFGKTAEERLENIEKMLSQFAAPASKNQNKPQSYYGLPPKGKQASTSKVAANYDPTDGDFNEQEAVRDEIVAALAKKFKGVKDSASLNAFDVGNNHYSLHGEWVSGHDNDLKTRIQVPTRAKYVAAIVKAVVDAEKGGKQASVKTAGGSGAANAAFLRQSPLKDKVLRAVAKHYGTSVKEIEAELTDPDAEAVFEYIGNDAALQMQVYREFKSKGYR